MILNSYGRPWPRFTHTHTHTHTDMQAMLNDPEQLRATMTPFLEMMGGDKEKFEEMLQNPAELQNKMKGE